MNALNVQSSVRSAGVPLERLTNNSSLSEREKLAEAARQFEAVLLRQILTAATKTVVPSALQQDSAAGNIYKDMLTEHLADAISQSRTLGLSNSLAAELSRGRPAAESAPEESRRAPAQTHAEPALSKLPEH